MKTVSDLCREALELRGNATQGEWVTSGDFCRENLSPKDYKSIEDNKLFAFAANHIKQIAERCLELEKQSEEKEKQSWEKIRLLNVASESMKKKDDEIQNLREALEKALDQLEMFNFAKDPMRVSNADTILRDALKGGQ